MEVTACIPTRGDVDLTPILASLPVEWERLIWTNGAARQLHTLIRIPPGVEAGSYTGAKQESYAVPADLRLDLGVYGRYAAMAEAQSDIVYTQDDDCILTPDAFRELERNYQEGVITANMPLPFREHYSDSCLIGFGAIFEKHLPEHAFAKIDEPWPDNIGRVCDVYFTTLTPMKWLNLEYENLPWATADNRMYRQKTHVGERAKALEHARSLR